ncbi:RNA polymerase II mediator complex subunit [Dipsacomyces acuminosporus]|nr:RNA polymerase II mediator complex subunit [Dipsacomyces acuminosporus]
MQQNNRKPAGQPLDSDLEAMERKIRESLETLSQISITVDNYESADEQVLQRRVENLVRAYSDMHSMKESLDTNIPLEVLSFIEDGRNPDEFTRNFTERVAAENQFTNGKISALSSFKDEFEANLKKFFPEEASDRLGGSGTTTTTTSGSGSGSKNDSSSA